MPNHLQGSTSPYLLQHADNPVDWYPWDAQALQRAQDEDKPIFLSIGYSACHWCHVMAHESFEDESVAALLNQHFVSIKVDREERPDLDRIYMSAVQSLTGNGGWPMSVFLLPDGRPFYGGTYFPPEPRYGMPSFSDLLLGIADAWLNRREDLEHNGQQLLDMLQQRSTAERQVTAKHPSRQVLDKAVERLRADYDWTHGGWGAAPKFPQPMLIEFLLRHAAHLGDSEALTMATHALDAMALGGIYDQLGGGFHRYAVDAVWLTPHFEKMLYDNAQLARVYLHAWQITRKPLYRAVVQETLDWALSEMRDPAGGFYAAWDADSQGHEGIYYIWSQAEIEQILQADAGALIDAYGVTPAGNFEGENILWLRKPDQRNALAATRTKLLAVRRQRIRPHLDDKVILSWNGLMLATLAEAGAALDRADYAVAAQETAAFLLSAMRQPDGGLLRSWRAGHAHLAGYLEDYTHLIDGLLALYQSTQEKRWFVAADELAKHMLAHFGAGPSAPGFYDTGDQHPALIVRPREMQDNATPSGNAMAVSVLQKLARLQQDPNLERIAVKSSSAMQTLAGQHPMAFGRWLLDLQEMVAPSHQVIVVGPKGDLPTQALFAAATVGFHPQRLVIRRDPGTTEHTPVVAQEHDLFDGQPTAYVCDHVQCYPPVTLPTELSALLGRLG